MTTYMRNLNTGQLYRYWGETLTGPVITKVEPDEVQPWDDVKVI